MKFDYTSPDFEFVAQQIGVFRLFAQEPIDSVTALYTVS